MGNVRRCMGLWRCPRQIRNAGALEPAFGGEFYGEWIQNQLKLLIPHHPAEIVTSWKLACVDNDARPNWISGGNAPREVRKVPRERPYVAGQICPDESQV